MQLKIGDYLITLLVLAIAVAIPILYTTEEMDNVTAIITKDGQEIRRINLSTLENPQIIELQDKYYDKIVAEKGRIRFTEADCPEKICVKTGWLTKPGQLAVCLPNSLIIKIEGSNQAEIDAYIR